MLTPTSDSPIVTPSGTEQDNANTMADVSKKQDTPAQEGIELKDVAKPAAVVQTQPKTPTTTVHGPAPAKLIDIDNSAVDAEKQDENNANGTACPQAPAAPESVASNAGLKDQYVLTAPADEDNEFRREEDYLAFMRRERHVEYRKRPWKLLRPLKERFLQLKGRIAFKKPAIFFKKLGNKIKANKPVWFCREALVPSSIVLLCAMLVMSVAAIVAMSFVIKQQGNGGIDTSVQSALVIPRSLPVVSLDHELRGDYLDGTSGILEEHTVIDLVKNSLVASATTSDTCDDAATTMAVASAIVNATLSGIFPGINATSTSIFPVIFNTSAIQSMSMADISSAPVVTPFLTTTLSSVTMATVSSLEQCGETGDGAGPCTRPYGRPNPTPPTVLQPSAIAQGLNGSTAFSAADALSASAPAVGICNPTATVVITVTVPVLSAWTANATTIHVGTSTDVTLQTSTLSLVETETVAPFGNMSTSAPTALTTTLANGITATLSIANFTLTLGSPNGSMSTSRADPASATNTIVVVSGGGDKVAPPKPLGASGTGSGVYCTVMLVAVLALLR